ncbi:MAG: hypothetical protein OQL09_06495 [Gammaproteobacteria bacterium]|nr:hypothetical protein [Gammaproteobacteria bacterium]
MKQIKALIAGLIIGLLIGLWFGVNIGKDKSIFSNPFAEDSIQQKIKKSGERLIEKSGEALEQGGKALKEKVKDAESQIQ